MDHQVEPGGGEHREVVHRALDDLEINPPLAGHGTVEREHRGGDVEHRHSCPGGCVERAVLAAAGGKAEHVEAVEPYREPWASGGARRAQPAARVAKRLVRSWPREWHALGGQTIPGAAVVVDHRCLLRRPLSLTHGGVDSGTAAGRRRRSPTPPRATSAPAQRSP